LGYYALSLGKHLVTSVTPAHGLFQPTCSFSTIAVTKCNSTQFNLISFHRLPGKRLYLLDRRQTARIRQDEQEPRGD